MRFHTISPPLLISRHPWTINISTSQSIFILKHMPNAVCGCEDTWLLFIHLIYLYFFPEGETLVSIHLRWLLAITEHLEPLLNGPAGNAVLKRSPRFRAKRCVCFVYFFKRVTDLWQERCQICAMKYKKLVSLFPAWIWSLFWSCPINNFPYTFNMHISYVCVAMPSEIFLYGIKAIYPCCHYCYGWFCVI